MVSLKRLFSPVRSFDPDQAKSFMAEHKEGTYVILDVRQPAEYEEAHITGAKLIPLPQLHDSIKKLDLEQPIITYCAVGGRSRVAAQLLSGAGFKEVYNLKGGIKAWSDHKAVGPKELNLDILRGDETPEEIAVLAYGMEAGLQTFYEQMIEKGEDPELRQLLSKLIDIEENHKKMLRELHAKIAPSGKAFQAFEVTEGSTVMEGGFNMMEFIEQNAPFLDAVQDVIDLAMMLETQALDLYLRFAEKSSHSETKNVLFRIADEEKGHLSALGRLLEEKL